MNAGRAQPLSAGASVQGQPLQTRLPVKPGGPGQAVLVPVRAGCRKPQMCPNRQRPRRAHWGGCRPSHGQLLSGWLCVSCFVNSFMPLLYVVQLENGVETTALGFCSPFLFCRSVGFFVFLISVAAEGALGRRVAPVPSGAAMLLHHVLPGAGSSVWVLSRFIRKEREGEKRGGGGGKPVALAMTEHRWCPVSHDPEHFGLCGPPSPRNRPKNYVLQLH